MFGLAASIAAAGLGTNSLQQHLQLQNLVQSGYQNQFQQSLLHQFQYTTTIDISTYEQMQLAINDCEFGYENAMYITGTSREDLNQLIVSLYTKMEHNVRHKWSINHDEAWHLYAIFEYMGDYVQIDLIHNSDKVTIKRIIKN